MIELNLDRTKGVGGRQQPIGVDAVGVGEELHILHRGQLRMEEAAGIDYRRNRLWRQDQPLVRRLVAREHLQQRGLARPPAGQDTDASIGRKVDRGRTEDHPRLLPTLSERLSDDPSPDHLATALRPCLFAIRATMSEADRQGRGVEQRLTSPTRVARVEGVALELDQVQQRVEK